MFWAFSNQRRRTNGWALAAALLAAGCTGRPPETSVPAKTVSDWFPIKVGGQVVQMQIALNPAEMSRGLMERRDLGPDQGMLFVYPEPQPMSFWMRDTPLPLDIGFFDRDGVLRETYAMQPFDEAPIRSRDQRLQFALEMNQRWYHEHGVRPGAQLDLAALREALKARSAAPEDFGLR